MAQAFSSALGVGAGAQVLGAAAGGAAGGVGAAAGGVAVASMPAFPSLVPSLAPNPSDTNGPSAIATAEGPPDLLEPPCYRMCRSVKTVEALWHEWTVGLNGQPSVSALDSKWGNRWRAGRQAELQWYSLRLEVIKEIRRMAQMHRSSEQQVMRVLQHHQQQMGYSLDRFCKHLRAGRAGTAGRAGGKGIGRQAAVALKA